MRDPNSQKFVLSFATNNTLLWYGWREYDLNEWLFRFDKLEDRKIVSVDDFDFKKQDSKHYDCIILDLPYLVSDKRNPKTDIISYFINHLNKDWVLFVCISSWELQQMKKLWYEPSGLVEYRLGFRSLPGFKPIVSIFRKDNPDKLFVASFDRPWELDVELIKKHFIEWTSGSNLIEWFFIDRNDFRSIKYLKVVEEIRWLRSEYKDFETKQLRELWDIMDVDMSKEEDNCIYIPNIWTMEVVSSLFDLTKKPQNYFKVKLKSDEVSKEFLVNYFKSDIAKLSLEWCFSSGYIPKISKSNLRLLEIPVLPKDMQDKMNQAYKKLDDMKNSIIEIEKNLSENPKNIDSILSNLTDEKLKGISEADKLRKLISWWESLDLEFKETFFFDVKTKREEKYIKREALKTIAWFMNQEWWTLLVWVDDHKVIKWLDPDNYQTEDKYLQKIWNTLESTFWKDVYSLVKYFIVEVDQKKVLRVDCQRSKEIVFMKWEEDWVYVRQSPKTIKYVWADLIKFSAEHKKRTEELEKLTGLINYKSKE